MGTNVHIVLQARTNSSRLPGKALLPVAGVPSAVLAGLRAARGGLPLTVATSDSPSNDPLAAAFQAAGLPVFRGDEQDVLGRFAAATSALPEGAIVVRLTGDNVFPDGDFISLLVESMIAAGADIMGTQNASGLPYGLSAEAFRLSALRRAAQTTDALFDREHVTPWLYRNGHSANFARAKLDRDLSCLRCTLDIPDDYCTLTRVFEGVSDPVAISWRDLVARLALLPESPKLCIPRNQRGASSLVLGTAQLGAPYGSVSKTRAPSDAESVALVRSAIRHGVTQIDTAQAYPGSEARLGAALSDGWASRVQVITKLSPLADVPADASEHDVEKAVDASIAASRQRLGLSRLPVLLLHRASHLRDWNGAAWRQLLRLRMEGHIGQLGVSVQSVEEAQVALAVTGVHHIQLACNILDTRWNDAGIPALAASRPEVVVHARSALLQGVLLCADLGAWPKISGLDVVAISGWLARMAEKFGRRDVADLCYAWLRAQNWIDAVVVGMENEAQLTDNAALFTRPPLNESALMEIAMTRPSIPTPLLNPALWPRLSA
jgi:spore coat polysaccharide biosynthesis protein SpsF